MATNSPLTSQGNQDLLRGAEVDKTEVPPIPQDLKAWFTLPETKPASGNTWKWMVGIRSFPFGARPIFRGELLVSGSVFETCCWNKVIIVFCRTMTGLTLDLCLTDFGHQYVTKLEKMKRFLFHHHQVDCYILNIILNPYTLLPSSWWYLPGKMVDFPWLC